MNQRLLFENSGGKVIKKIKPKGTLLKIPCRIIFQFASIGKNDEKIYFQLLMIKTVTYNRNFTAFLKELLNSQGKFQGIN